MKTTKIAIALSLILSANAYSADSNSCSDYDSATKKCNYQRSVAVQYADNNWNYTTDNIPFPYYSVGTAANCANFISQAILAGLVGSTNRKTLWNELSNFATDNGSNTPLEWYYISDSDRGPAWTGAAKMYEYATSNKSSYKGMHFDYVTHDTTSSFMDYNAVKEGDVIFADWDGDSTIDHTMIVTDFSDLRDAYDKIHVTYQSSERHNKSLSAINKEKNYNALFYVYRPTFYRDTGL